jgi:hypothetical protein
LVPSRHTGREPIIVTGWQAGQVSIVFDHLGKARGLEE